jgi:hypothetical protein
MNFFKIKDIVKYYANKVDIYLTCSYQNASDCLTNRYCHGKFVITPEGAISICHYVSSSDDDLYEKFFFGHIDDTGNVIIDHNKANEILACNVNTYKRCGNCILFARQQKKQVNMEEQMMCLKKSHPKREE